MENRALVFHHQYFFSYFISLCSCSGYPPDAYPLCGTKDGRQRNET